MANTVVASGTHASMDDLPLWIQPTGLDPALNYSGITDRTLIDAVFATEGVLSPTDFVVSQRATGANFSVDVSAGRFVATGDSVANQGKYLSRSTGVVNVAYSGGAPVSGTRVHRVIARLRDKSAAGADYDWTLEWLEDTGTGMPAEPPSAITLATVSIAAGQASVQTAHITDRRRYATAPGGQLPVRNQTDRDTITPANGLGIWRLDQKWAERGNGTKWMREPVRVRTFGANYANDTVQKAVTGLTIPLDANTAYAVQLYAFVFSIQNVGLALALSYPTGASIDGVSVGWWDTDGLYRAFQWAAGNPTQLGSYGYAGSINTTSVVCHGTVETGANPGNLTVMAAQRASNATGSSIGPSSWLEVRQVA